MIIFDLFECSELTNFATLAVRSQQVDNLDSGYEDFLFHTHVCELRGFLVNTGLVDGGNGTSLIDGLSNNVHNTSQTFGSHRDHNRGAGINTSLSSDKTFSTIHSNGSNCVVTWNNCVLSSGIIVCVVTWNNCVLSPGIIVFIIEDNINLNSLP